MQSIIDIQKHINDGWKPIDLSKTYEMKMLLKNWQELPDAKEPVDYL